MRNALKHLSSAGGLDNCVCTSRFAMDLRGRPMRVGDSGAYVR